MRSVIPRIQKSILKSSLLYGTMLSLSGGFLISVPAASADEAADNNDRTAWLLEEITVTARKREEGLQSTPIAISAFTGEQLQACRNEHAFAYSIILLV